MYKRNAPSNAPNKRAKTKSAAVARVSRSRFTAKTFPPIMKSTLRYSEQRNITVTAGSSNYVYRANDLYDPNYSGVGTQPLYFDQLMAIYNHFHVAKSRITVKLVDSTAYYMNASLYVDDDTSFESTAEGGAERPGSVSTCWTGNTNTPLILKNKWSAATTFGGSLLSNTALQGTVSAGPSEQSFYVINITDTTAGRTGSTVGIAVLIEYDVYFDELKTIARS